MKICSASARAAKKFVTNQPEDAGLAKFSQKEVDAGAARGIVCGSVGDDLLLVQPGIHVVACGRTGCGKTRSIIEPTIIANSRRGRETQPHMVIVDIKGTLLNETERLVEDQGYAVKVLDLTGSRPSPDSWNPLSEAYALVESGNLPAAEASIARLKEPLVNLINDDSDKYWQAVAWPLIASTALGLMMKRKKEVSLSQVSGTIANKDDLLTLAFDLGRSCPSGLKAVKELRGVEKTFACVQSTALAMLEFFETEIARSVARTSTINFDEQFFGSTMPTAVYLVVPDYTSVGHDYSALFLDQFYRCYSAEFERRKLEGKNARPVLLIEDEFPAIPRHSVVDAARTARSRGFSILLAYQSASSLVEKNYSQAEAAVLTEQAAAAIYMACTSPEVGEDLHLKSGGAVGCKDLMSLERGNCYVSVAGRPVYRAKTKPFRPIPDKKAPKGQKAKKAVAEAAGANTAQSRTKKPSAKRKTKELVTD